MDWVQCVYQGVYKSVHHINWVQDVYATGNIIGCYMYDKPFKTTTKQRSYYQDNLFFTGQIVRWSSPSHLLYQIPTSLYLPQNARSGVVWVGCDGDTDIKHSLTPQPKLHCTNHHYRSNPKHQECKITRKWWNTTRCSYISLSKTQERNIPIILVAPVSTQVFKGTCIISAGVDIQ